MGGSGKLGTAPLSTCSPQAMRPASAARSISSPQQKQKDAPTAEVTCATMIGVREDGGFGLVVKMLVLDKSIGGADLAVFVREAHETICPDSHATRGNVMSHSRWSAAN
jgi:organic hydroperoxide reductase OsmC/OhrA